ncbi:putative cytochrome c (plasmid) [Ralstonia solanacearum CMR15]|nr:putative cytochrome c [Ralstonia solanacearum CMR15]
MRTKTTLCLMLIGGAVLVACGQKETAAPASAAAAQVQSSTPATVAAAPAPENALGKRTYGSVCSMCHAAGVAGAPKPGDKADWGPRVAQGKDTLYKHALEGFNGNTGAMPARGGSTLPDDAVKAAVDYMVARSQ